MTPIDATSRIAAVVVTYNRLEHIQATVSRLLEEGVDDIVIVDNGSRDGTRDWLGTLDDGAIHTLFSEANLGGAGGFARGMSWVRTHLDADWVLLCDDDGRPMPGAIPAFREMDKTGYDGFAAAVYYPSGEICDMNRPGRNPFNRPLRRGQLCRISQADYRAGQTIKIDMATFVGLFLSRRALQAVQGPDPRLFIYGDDLIHTLQLSQAGMRLAFAPHLRFEHDCSTLKGQAQIYHPLWKTYYHYRNAVLLYRQAAGWLAWPVLAMRIPKWWLAGRHYGDDRADFNRLLRKAIADGIRGDLCDPPADVPQVPACGQSAGVT